MKKIILLLISLSFLSCSLDDGNEVTFHREFLPILSVDAPEFFTQGEDHEITVTYTRPNSCYQFDYIYYTKNNNERTVAVLAKVLENNNNCIEVVEESETTFTVRAEQEETYVFNFWQGVDDNGEDMYLIIEVPVEQ
ncbi:hypothetical protein [Mesoflavibacter sp. CH_XMU1404-2]|uniref:hypothetical protein n=1 Tax=Mesoflavibacter sp. CH_XMU1404-2 TaxID=3107766 RepID=UPI00300800EF